MKNTVEIELLLTGKSTLIKCKSKAELLVELNILVDIMEKDKTPFTFKVYPSMDL